MATLVPTREGDRILVVRQGHHPSLQVYKLIGREEHGFRFYGAFHRFELALDKDMSLSAQPYGHLGSCSDLSGRAMTAIGKDRRPVLSTTAVRMTTLERPLYSFIGEYHRDSLDEILEWYRPREEDLPYASISTSALAAGDSGDDVYLNTLFLMTDGYGLLTKISAVAGRDIEDCCSPEFHFETHKVRLDTNPLRRIRENDVVPGAVLVGLGVVSNPGIIPPFELESGDDPHEVDRLLDELFLTLTQGCQLVPRQDSKLAGRPSSLVCTTTAI